MVYYDYYHIFRTIIAAGTVGTYLVTVPTVPVPFSYKLNKERNSPDCEKVDHDQLILGKLKSKCILYRYGRQRYRIGLWDLRSLKQIWDLDRYRYGLRIFLNENSGFIIFTMM